METMKICMTKQMAISKDGLSCKIYHIGDVVDVKLKTGKSLVKQGVAKKYSAKVVESFETKEKNSNKKGK